MKKIKYLVIAGLVLLASSCEKNEPQAFNPADSNASFPVSTASVDENATSAIEIPLALAGIPGSGAVTVTVTVITEGETNPAIEGVDFTIENKVLTFPEGYGTQMIKVTPIDNDVFTGKKTFTIAISSTTPQLSESVQNSVKVTIVDNEHPWAAIIGNYEISGESLFNGPTKASASILASDADVNTLLLIFATGTYPGAVSPLELKVDDSDGEIIVQANDNQYIGATPKPTNAYLPYFRGMDIEGDEFVATKFVGIFDNGVITFEMGYGVEAIHPATGASGGFFEIMNNGVIFTKK